MQEHQQGKNLYKSFFIEIGIDFVIMFLVMYTMIASLDHFYLNLNNVYMTLMMVAPMGLLMLGFMRGMYPSGKVNLAIAAGAVVIFLFAFWGMRTQAFVGDHEFLRSMIPHHSGAVLMCEQAKLSDPRIVSLCDDIVRSQREEIAQMKALLAET
ncbi:DUF305 domain-containing protein [Brevundimonas vesicularis]|uniref:DUF305 domain-containing protein n=1 Tax=Brevundimonas vesicularis TaxID=41276 RepID=UPI00082E4ADD|nr:DUF305 domain-containing protein [Brevundimonas vesicularis]